ncbi:MAG: carboxypeptidase-like regulatory domain-containing protein, partial [Thaumarchaeota archaeon]|nr:carboxypeptidase-like regulatory domain-containing protein [Candidatus Terraquivivens yellowstonensis]
VLMINCTVYDLMLQIVDKLGAPLEPANTKVVLFRPNGPPVEFAGLPTEHTVALPSRIYNIVFYDWISSNGTLLVYQLPGELGPYGVQVYYQGVLVYENLTLVPKLVKTENFTLVTNVVKVMVKITDAHDAGLARTPVFYEHPVYGTIMTLTGDEGVIDFGRIPAPELKFLSVYWKGVNVKFFEIKYPDGTVQPAEPDGTAIIKTANATSLPIIVRAKITDIIFYTWDFQKVEKIPRVNITMSWWGLNITTGKMVKFVETMDGNDGKPWDVEFDTQYYYNTSKIVAQFFSYRITYYSDEGKAIFHQMPALDEDLNKPEINVTTATYAWKWNGAEYERVPLPEEYVTPGSALWNYTHGRLVLRVLPKSYNPDVYYPDILAALNFKNITFCRRITIDLPLWAMGFKVVAINGERWLDGAEFSIKNDRGIMMEIVKSNATEPILYVSRVDKDNPLLSKIWWNGTYTCEDLYFKTDMGVVVDMFTWYRPGGTWPQNIAPWPDYVADNYTFILTPDIDLKNAWKTTTSLVTVYNITKKYVNITYYVPYIYDKELLKVPLPVGFITLELKDQGGVRPIKYAFVNITAHTNQIGYPVYNLAGYGKAQWAGKTDAEGKAEIIAPTAGFLNYTLKKNGGSVIKYFNITVYWYLNSSVVYEAYFNLTKMGWKVDKVAVSDVVLRHTVCSDWNRPVKGLYADLAWVNVTAPNTYVHPGRLVANDTAKTWILEPLNETMGKAPWVDGELELNLVPTAMHYKVYDYFVNDYVEWNVSHLWRVAAWYTGLQKGPVQAPDGKSYKQLMFGSGTDESPVSSAVYVIIGAAPFDHTTYTYMPGTTNKGLLVSYDVVSGITKNDHAAVPSNVGKIGPYTFDRSLQLIKYLEPAKTTEIIEATRTVKHVALKLNATDIAVRVVWQQGENATATYVTGPLVGWTVKLTFVPPAEYLTDAEREALWTAWKKTFVVTTDETGTAWIRSGSTPDTVIWNASRIKAGMTKDTSWLVVSPPAYMLNEKDPYWLNNVVKPGAEAHGLSVFEGTQDPSAMVGVDLTPEGYFAWLPDPSLWVKDPYEGAKSKIYDLYGLPVELEVQNEWGAGLWLPSYFGGVNGSGWSRIGGAWYARINVWPNDPKTSQHVPFSPIFQYMPVTARILDFNGRPLPGAFLWMIDSVTGKTAGWSYAGKDGVTETVYLRKPEWTLLLRVSYLGRDADGKPAWPFNAFGKWPVSYYSDADETQPGPGIFGELAKRVKVTTLAHEYHGVWRIRPGAHWDITARIFDIKIRHYYATSKPIEVDATFYREFPDKPGGIVEFKAKEVIEVNRLNRGTYEDVAKWLGVTVGRKSFDLSAANVGTVAGELEVAVGDMSVAVKDLNGRLLSDAIAKFEGVEQKLTIPSEILAKYKLASEDDAKSLKAVGAVFVTKLPIPTNIRYSLDVSWTSPDFGTEAKVSIVDTVDGINAKKEIVLPVGAVTINVVDGKGRAVSGAEVSLGAVKAKTDAAGKAVFESVPLEKEGRGITYQITVTREGEEVFKDTVTFSTTKTSITVIGELFDLTVFVKGAAGQGLPFATVTLKKAGVVVGHFTTDEGGSVTIPKLVAADYEVEATYKGYTGTVKVSKADLIAGKSAEITLPPYIEIAGMPLTFATFLALIIGIILLIIVVVVIAFEYVRWRGRRVGIFPPPPPKK